VNSPEGSDPLPPQSNLELSSPKGPDPLPPQSNLELKVFFKNENADLSIDEPELQAIAFGLDDLDNENNEEAKGEA
jgi:hypothetical protein